MSLIIVRYNTIKTYYCSCGEAVPNVHDLAQDGSITITTYKDMNWRCPICSSTTEIIIEYMSYYVYVPPPSPPGLLGDWYYDSDEGDTVGTVFDHATHADNIGDGTITDYDGGGA